MKELTYDRRTRRIVGVGRIEGPDLVTVPASDRLYEGVLHRADGRLRKWIFLVGGGRAILLEETVNP